MTDHEVPVRVACALVAIALLFGVAMATAFLLVAALLDWRDRRRGRGPHE